MTAAASLRTLSERGRRVPESEDPSMRELLVGNYRLVYEVDGSRVRIVAFLHGARDFARWRGRERGA